MPTSNNPASVGGDEPRRSPAFLLRWTRRLGGLVADRQLHAVLLVWAWCWLACGMLLHYFGTPLPWCDEWELTPVAAGREPLTLEWLWRPANEHRAPLTRLEVLLLGRLNGWDLRLAHGVNLAMMALGGLALVLAARAVRGSSALSDAFLPLIVLTPWQFETIVVYAYAYAMALMLLCVAASAVMTGWPLRSTAAVLLYLALLLALTFAGGPAGNVWAVGLCAVVLRGWLEKTSRGWKAAALVGTVVVVAASGVLLALTPHTPHHDGMRSDSWRTTLVAGARVSVGWLGPPAQLLWPWALLAVAVPGIYVLGRVLWDCRLVWRARNLAGANLGAWIDLAPVLLATLAVALLIGYGRGRGMSVNQPRYCTLVLPVGVLAYLLMVRLRAPVAVSGALAFLMAVCYGWCWPDVIGHTEAWHQGGAPMVAALRTGQYPLSVLTWTHGRTVGYPDPDKLLAYLLQLREAGLSVFGKKLRSAPTGMGPPQVWAARTGRLTGGLHLVADAKAVGGQAVEAAAAGQPAGAAVYDIDVPAAGTYELCCRVAVPGPAATLTVRADEAPVVTRSLPYGPNYYGYQREPLLFELTPGRHRLVLTLQTEGAKMDFLEFLPRGPGQPPAVAAAVP